MASPPEDNDKRRPPASRRKRTLAPDEAELWSKVAKTVTPIKDTGRRSAPETGLRSIGFLDKDVAKKKAPLRKSREPEAPVKPGHAGPVTPRPLASPSAAIRPPSHQGAASDRKEPAANGAKAHLGGGLDRRTAQRLRRGQVDIEARIDLHGMTQAEAHRALNRFLTSAQSGGKRCVLVITGKGESPYARHTLHGQETYHAPERGGVLRRLLPMWLTEEPLRRIVIGHQPAHPKHGGGGAFYVYLRRQGR